MSSPLLEVKDLQVVVGEENKVLLDGLNLTVNAGETHVLMGHNGAGKSTLMSALMGDPRYTVTRGQIIFRGQDITHETADVRARAGMFLSFQTPEEIPGITLESFLRTAAGAVTGKPVKVMKFRREMAAQMEALNMDPSYADRYLNVGFSGGEKKRAEVLQLELLKPKFAILDETDSGLDVDALRIVSEGVNRAKEANQFGILMVTHYTRILRYIKPDIVHVFADGHFIKTGGPELADELEETGYDAYLPEGSDSESALA
jgi:Fe-S cluster assembly ATP-binding protein